MCHRLPRSSISWILLTRLPGARQHLASKRRSIIFNLASSCLCKTFATLSSTCIGTQRYTFQCYNVMHLTSAGLYSTVDVMRLSAGCDAFFGTITCRMLAMHEFIRPGSLRSRFNRLELVFYFRFKPIVKPSISLDRADSMPTLRATACQTWTGWHHLSTVPRALSTTLEMASRTYGYAWSFLLRSALFNSASEMLSFHCAQVPFAMYML